MFSTFHIKVIKFAMFYTKMIKFSTFYIKVSNKKSAFPRVAEYIVKVKHLNAAVLGLGCTFYKKYK
jgi:hypothetical protein